MTHMRTTTMSAAQAAYDNMEPDDGIPMVACHCDSCGNDWEQEDVPPVCPECGENDEEDISRRAFIAPIPRRRTRRLVRTEGTV